MEQDLHWGGQGIHSWELLLYYSAKLGSKNPSIQGQLGASFFLVREGEHIVQELAEFSQEEHFGSQSIQV